MKKIILCLTIVLLTGCAYLQKKPPTDPTFSLQKVTITERSDGSTLQVQKEFQRVAKEEFDLLSEIEKAAWNLVKKQVGL